MKPTLHIYTRVSSVIQQEEGTSLENQKHLGIRKAQELGYDYQLWNEGGQSSFYDDLHNRPVLVSLLTSIESGDVKDLFVYNTDRLSRNQQTWAVIRYKLLAHHVTLHTASGQMNLKNPVDDLMLGILSEISQYDNRIRTERSRLGRFQKIQQGNWKGGVPPFGYRLNNKHLEIDPFESEWVKKIFDWYCLGGSIKAIQLKLSRNGVVTRRGNQLWSLGSIQLILKNTVYAGHYDYRDKMIGETVRISSPTIIGATLFQSAQDRRKRFRQSGQIERATKHFYLLRGLLVCGHCGSYMGGRTNKAGHQNLYYCTTKERQWKSRTDESQKWKRGIVCSMTRSINIENTDRQVIEIAKSILEEIHQHSLNTASAADEHQDSLDDLEAISTAGFTAINPSDFVSLPGTSQREIIRGLIERIEVFFDRPTSTHRLDIQHSERVKCALKTIKPFQ